MSKRLSATTLALMAAGTLFAVGCNKLSASMVEDVIRQDLAKKGHTMKSVTCPEGRDFKQDSFDCNAVDSAGKPVVLKVTVKPTHGDKADIRYSGTIDGKPVGN